MLALRSDSLTPENAASIRHLVKAHFRALDFLSQQPQDAAQLMANHLNMKPEQVLPSYAGIHLPGVAENRQLLDGAFPGLLNSAHMISAFMTTAKLLPKEASLSELISAAYLPHGK